MKRWIKSATSVANNNAKKIAKETFGTWYNDTNKVKIFKQSTGYALKYYASTPAEADRVLDNMIQTAEYFEIPVIKSFTKLGFLGSVHHYVACIVVPASESEFEFKTDITSSSEWAYDWSARLADGDKVYHYVMSVPAGTARVLPNDPDGTTYHAEIKFKDGNNRRSVAFKDKYECMDWAENVLSEYIKNRMNSDKDRRI